MHARIHNRRPVLVLLATLVFALSGCRDSLISSPETDNRRSVGETTTVNCEGSAEGGYICDPISGGGSEPPPQEDPGTCNINTGANCDNFPGAGGGGDEGGGTGGSGDDGSFTAPASLAGDFTTDTIPPDCTAPRSALERAVCSSKPPEGEWLQRTKDALTRIEQRGEPCATIARRGWFLLNENRLGYFPRQDGLGGGYGNTLVGAYLEDLWVTEVYNRKDSYGRNLDWGLVHELEHASGLAHSHTDTLGVEHTPNDTRCAG